MDSSVVYQMFTELSVEDQRDFLNMINSQPEIPDNDFDDIRDLFTRHSNNPLPDRVNCPHCQSVNVVKNGHKDDIQRFKCKDCRKSFTWTNNTILYGSKKDLSVWDRFCECLMNKFPLRKCCEICKISLHTAFNWRHKILDALQNMHHSIHLDGIIETDETFFDLSFKGNRNLEESHHRGSMNHVSGISNQLVCVPCSVNHVGLSIGQITNLGKPTIKDLKKLLNSDHFMQGSILVTDSLANYDTIAADLDLTHVKIPSGKHSNGQFNIQKINSYHNELKRLVNRHFKGVATKYLNNYVVYNNFVNWAKGSFYTLLGVLKDFVYTTVCNTKGYKIVLRQAIPL